MIDYVNKSNLGPTISCLMNCKSPLFKSILKVSTARTVKSLSFKGQLFSFMILSVDYNYDVTTPLLISRQITAPNISSKTPKVLR